MNQINGKLDIVNDRISELKEKLKTTNQSSVLKKRRYNIQEIYICIYDKLKVIISTIQNEKRKIIE